MMDALYITPTLAAIDLTELIWVGLFLVITVGGWLANAIKESQTKREAQKSGGRKEASVTGQRTQLDEIVARRRRQVEELARRRTMARSGTAAPADRASEPGNLTMGERVRRDRAKEQYERRAEALRAQREAEARQAQQQAQRRRALLQRAEQERAAAARVKAAERQLQREESTPPKRAQVSSLVHKAPQGEALQVVGRSSSQRMKLSAASLREAVVLKEILDPPVAMRPPGDDF